MVRLSVRGDVLFRSRLAGVFPHEGTEGGSLHEARQPGIERVHQLFRFPTGAPSVELIEAYGRLDVELRVLADEALGNAFLADGVVDVGMSHERKQLLASVLGYFPHVYGVGNLHAQMADAEPRRRTFGHIHGLSRKSQR